VRARRFIMVFLLVVCFGFAVLSWTWTNDHVVAPWTEALAAVSGQVLRLLGEEVKTDGVVLEGRFAVEIENGCNGLEAVLIYFAAVLASPGRWRWKVAGLVVGMVGIQAVNVARVVALYITGVYRPEWFNASHTVVWQTAIILASIGFWIAWVQVANRESA